MMKRKWLIGLIAALGCGSMAHGALELRLERGGDTWGYASPQNFAGQEWDGSPVTVTVEMELFQQPGMDRPIMPWQSWCGIYLDGYGSRYALGLNNGGDAAVTAVPFGAVFYENSGNIQSVIGTESWPMQAGKLWLRGSFDGSRVALAVSADGNQFREVWSRPTPQEFKPTLIGVCLNSSQGTSNLDKIAFHRFEVDGAGPAKSDDFSGALPWRFSLPGVSLLNDHWKISAAPALVPQPPIRLEADGEVSEWLRGHLQQPGRTLIFPAGTYRFDRLELPAYTRLSFEPGAVIAVGPATTLVVQGDGVVIDGALFDLPAGGRSGLALITGDGVNNLRLEHLATTDYDHEVVVRDYDLAVLNDCRDITVSGCRIGGIRNVIHMTRCARVVVRDNRATDCATMTSFADGSEFLQHYGNWSTRVTFQCQWWGGDSNDHNPGMTPDTARIARRDLKPGDAGFQLCNSGVYDILVENNIAEYGVCLAWGSKGRNVVMTGNTARFMGDLAYDTEGGENVIISNNISVNSTCAGIGCYFYGERLLIANNQLFTFDEGEDRYKGGFIRVHSPGGSDHFGNGEVLITGNQMVNQTARPVGIALEATRNVVVSNNTFRNGSLYVSWAADDVIISDNVFNSDLADQPWVIFAKGTKHRWQLRGNVIRNFSDNRELIAVQAEAEDGGVVLVNNYFENYATPIALDGSGSLTAAGNIADGKSKITGDWQQRTGSNLEP